MSRVRDQYSASAPKLESVLQQATAAIARAREAVGLQVSSRTKRRAKATKASKKASPVQKKIAVRKVADAPTAKTAKKSKSVKQNAKKRAAKQSAPVPVVQAATTKAAVQ